MANNNMSTNDQQSVLQSLLGHLLGGDEDDGSNQDTKSTSSDAEDEQTQAQQLLGQLLSRDTNTITEQKQKIIRIVECWTAMAGNERKAMVAEIYGKAFPPDKEGKLNESFPYPITYNDKTKEMGAGRVLRRLILWITDYPAAAEQLDLPAMYNLDLSNSKLSGAEKKKVLDKMNQKLEQNRIETNKKNMDQVNDALNTYEHSKQPLSQRLFGYMLSASSNDTNTQGQEDIELREELDRLIVKFANSDNDVDIESDMERAKQIFDLMDIGSSNVSNPMVQDSSTTMSYMANQTFAQLFNPPGQEYTNMKKSKIYHRTKMYLVLKDLVGVEGQPPPRDHPVWNEAVKLIMKNSQADNKAVDEVNAEQLHGWWSDESNHKHPFDQAIRKVVGLGSEDATLNELIEVMNDNKEFMMKMCPWMREEPSLAVSYLPSVIADSRASWWFDQIPNNKKKNAMRTISNYIKDAGRTGKESETGTRMNNIAIAQEIVAILQLESGLVINRNEYQAAVYKWLKSDINMQADTVLFNNHLMKSFFDWAGVADLSKWGGFEKYADVVNFKEANKMFNKYLENKTVKKFEKEMNRLADAEVNLINKALEKLPAISEHYNNRRNAKPGESGYTLRVYIGEKADRAANNETPSRTVRLPSGKEVEVPSYDELNYPVFHELHHVGPQGRKKKLETRFPKKADGTEGAVKQPCFYTKEEMEKQGPFMDMESQYYHRLVDLLADEDLIVNKGIRRELIKTLQDQLALKYNNNQCIVNSDHTVNLENLPAFDLHHLALLYDLQIGSTVLVTKKMSGPSRIKAHAKSHYDLMENLFPELIITRLIDCRYHSLFHYLLDNPKLMEDLELEFPYEVDKEKMIMKYTGEDDDIDDDKGSEEQLELPSVMKVLNQEWKGASRRTLG